MKQRTPLEKWLARWLDYGLKRQGWSQSELADHAFVTEKHISHMLNGEGAGRVAMWDHLLGTTGVLDCMLMSPPPEQFPKRERKKPI